MVELYDKNRDLQKWLDLTNDDDLFTKSLAELTKLEKIVEIKKQDYENYNQMLQRHTIELEKEKKRRKEMIEMQ